MARKNFFYRFYWVGGRVGGGLGGLGGVGLGLGLGWGWGRVGFGVGLGLGLGVGLGGGLGVGLGFDLGLGWGSGSGIHGKKMVTYFSWPTYYPPKKKTLHMKKNTQKLKFT